MISIRRKKQTKPLGTMSTVTARRSALTPRTFAAALERERDRADRSNVPFALVVFDCGRSRECRDAMVDVLSRRLRLADEFGRLEATRVGALLPATDAGGAWTVADDACLSLPDDSPLPECEVFVYPSADGSNRTEPAKGTRPLARTVELASRSSVELGINRAGDEVSVRDASVGEPVATARRTAPGVVRPFGAMFARPIPWWKRTLDILGAAIALVVLSPLFAVVAAAIKLTSPGPVFYTQWRAGFAGRRFRMYKFRSMVVNADDLKVQLMAQNEQDGPAFKIRNDPRVTTVGRIIRKLSIDEFPQFWNVLVGDMSLVGPRPLPCEESDQCLGWQRRRLDVTPGLTCVWQVTGRSQVSFDEWARMDLSYVRSRSLVHDMELIARTVPVVLSGRGAS